MQFINDLSDSIKHWIDSSMIGVTVLTLLQWVPAITGFVSVIWFLMRMYETYLGIKLKKVEIANANKRVD